MGWARLTTEIVKHRNTSQAKHCGTGVSSQLFKRQSGQDQEFKVSLGYMLTLKPTINRKQSKKQKQKTKQTKKIRQISQLAHLRETTSETFHSLLASVFMHALYRSNHQILENKN